MVENLALLTNEISPHQSLHSSRLRPFALPSLQRPRVDFEEDDDGLLELINFMETQNPTIAPNSASSTTLSVPSTSIPLSINLPVDSVNSSVSPSNISVPVSNDFHANHSMDLGHSSLGNMNNGNSNVETNRDNNNDNNVFNDSNDYRNDFAIDTDEDLNHFAFMTLQAEEAAAINRAILLSLDNNASSNSMPSQLNASSSVSAASSTTSFNQHLSSSGGTIASNLPTNHESQPSRDPNIAVLEGMGFDRGTAMYALSQAGGDLDLAINQLIGI